MSFLLSVAAAVVLGIAFARMRRFARGRRRRAWTETEYR
jgi:hypothetical protein